MSALAPTMQSFFTSYLIGQRGASEHTIRAYRDTMRLLLSYAHQRTGIEPSKLDIGMLDAELIAAFLAMLEQRRANTIRTRNTRLAAIHSLYRHAALRHPEHADLIARVLAIPPKNHDQTILTYLDPAEIDALLHSPNRSTWTGRRDHLIMLLMITTGVRVSELTALTRADVHTGKPAAHIASHGKGRKTRITPLDATTATAVRAWLAENERPQTTPLFTARGRPWFASDSMRQIRVLISRIWLALRPFEEEAPGMTEPGHAASNGSRRRRPHRGATGAATADRQRGRATGHR